MERTDKEKIWTDKSFIVYMVLVTVLSLTVEIIDIVNDKVDLVALLMWIPAFCALVANIITKIEKKEKLSIRQFQNRMGFRSSRFSWILAGCLIPLVYLLIPYLIYWTIYPDNFSYKGVSLFVILKDILPVMIIGIFISMLTALGEEIGWRGFMFPALNERVGLKKALLISGLYWACWHLPILMFGGYMAQCPMWYRVPAFILCVLPIGIIAGLLTIQSNSLWPAAFLHAAHNNYDQMVFQAMSRGDQYMYYVSETGALTIVCVWIIAIIMYRTYVSKNKETK